MKNTELKVSEIFYSVQGEGITIGRPAVFIRLAGCPLACVWCDTTSVWQQGSVVAHDDLFEELKANWGTFLSGENSRVVITGGSPTVQQKSLAPFLNRLMDCGVQNTEMETEGFVCPDVAIFETVDIFNVSPKLANSGVPYEKRINLETLNELRWHNLSCFKFVVGSRADCDEAMTIVADVKLPHDRVFFMPLASSRPELENRSRDVVEWCKEYNVCFSTRLHLHIWNQATGC